MLINAKSGLHFQNLIAVNHGRLAPATTLRKNDAH